MRASLEGLIKKAILFRYNLANEKLGINKSKISSGEDFCYSASCNDELARVIYNAIIDYAFNEYDIKEQDFNVLHRRALTSRLKFNEEIDEKYQLRYGFYGEILLYCMIHLFHKIPPAIARGCLYNILENGETKGYDCYHLVASQQKIELWFGEVKFYISYAAATTGKNGAITNLKKTLTDEYLNKNLIAISERQNDLAKHGSALVPVLADLKKNPDIRLSDLSKKHSIRLVYPILIIFDEEKDGYDATIKKVIQHIEDEVKVLPEPPSVEVSLFFMLMPVGCSRTIKTQVLKWIKDKEPLMS